MEKAFLFRLACTVLVFTIFKVCGVTSPGVLVGSLFLLDYLDCDVWNGKCMSLNYLLGKKIAPKEESYHHTDKIIDVFTYGVFLVMFGNIFDKYTLSVLWGFTLYRFLGVMLYLQTGNRKLLFYFPDFVNSTMVVYLLKYYVFPSINQRDYNTLLLIGMVFKMWFEYVNHDDSDSMYRMFGFL